MCVFACVRACVLCFVSRVRVYEDHMSVCSHPVPFSCLHGGLTEEKRTGRKGDGVGVGGGGGGGGSHVLALHRFGSRRGVPETHRLENRRGVPETHRLVSLKHTGWCP